MVRQTSPSSTVEPSSFFSSAGVGSGLEMVLARVVRVAVVTVPELPLPSVPLATILAMLFSATEYTSSALLWRSVAL